MVGHQGAVQGRVGGGQERAGAGGVGAPAAGWGRSEAAGAGRPASFAEKVMAALDRERDPAFAHLDDAGVERAVRVGAAELAAATCRWLEVVAELVVRGIWADQGARTPAEWLS